MRTRGSIRRLPCSCGYCAPLREARRRLAAQANHPHYATRGNEQPLLQDLLDADPPAGGLSTYLADLEKEG